MPGRVRLIALPFLALFSVGVSAQVQFNLESQPLAKALVKVSNIASLNVLYDPAEVDGIQAPPLKASLRGDEALDRLLVNTSLRAIRVGNHTLRIAERDQVLAAALKDSGADGGSASASSSPDRSLQGMPERMSSKSSHVSAELEEVVVTADKRSEKLMDVPSSITAVKGERLEALQINSLEDLTGYVPGASIVSGGAPGQRTVVLRGLNTTYSNSISAALVGTYIDDLPVGSAIGATRGGEFGLDLVPYDIADVEVLKGPQGTLYGANTMGGLIKYTLKKPDLTKVDARFGTEISHVDYSGGPNYAVRAALGAPLVENQLAFRVSGFYEHNDGYVDNVVLGTHDVNKSKEYGGRATLLWRPFENLSVQATAVIQNINVDNLTEETVNGATLQPIFGRYRTDTEFPEPTQQTTRLYSLSADWNLGFATLSSSSGWSVINNTSSSDLTVPFGQYSTLTPFGAPSLAQFNLGDRSNRFVEEIRLTSPTGRLFDWLAGIYYTRENATELEDFPTFIPTSYVPLPAADNLFTTVATTNYDEVAAFANLTYRLTDRFDITGGGRYSRYKEHVCPYVSAGFFGAGTQPCSGLPNTNVALWMMNFRYHFSDTGIVYARAATGYRPGMGCPTCGIPSMNIPGVVRSDKTTNFELGFKRQFMDQRLSLDADVFYIKWKDIQLKELTPQGFGYSDNGGKAISTGVEAEAAYQVVAGLRIGATAAYTDAHLTEDAPNAGGKDGDQLPDSPTWTGSLTADYKRPMTQSVSLILGGGYRYRDAIVNQFEHISESQGGPIPSGTQHLVDIYSGVALEQLTVRVYGKNIFNNHSYSGLLIVEDPSRLRMIPTQPRTIGISVDFQY